MPHASQHVLRPPACTALLQYDVVAYRRKKGITDKYVYQFQMIRREGQGPLLSEVSPSVYWFVQLLAVFRWELGLGKPHRRHGALLEMPAMQPPHMQPGPLLHAFPLMHAPAPGTTSSPMPPAPSPSLLPCSAWSGARLPPPKTWRPRRGREWWTWTSHVSSTVQYSTRSASHASHASSTTCIGRPALPLCSRCTAHRWAAHTPSWLAVPRLQLVPRLCPRRTACLPTDLPACLHLLPAGGKEAKPIAAIDTTWLALGELAGSGPQGDLPPCTGLDDVAKERELAGNVVRGINEARL
jgi:hypothetical protein